VTPVRRRTADAARTAAGRLTASWARWRTWARHPARSVV